MRSKDEWFRLYEKKLYELEDAKVPDAADIAAKWATATQSDNLADYADMLRQRRKDGEL